MHRERVSSTSLASVGYDAERHLLEIEFVRGGVYQYYAVPASIYRGLMAAESMGRYFVQHIRDRYPTTGG